MKRIRTTHICVVIAIVALSACEASSTPLAADALLGLIGESEEPQHVREVVGRAIDMSTFMSSNGYGRRPILEPSGNPYEFPDGVEYRSAHFTYPQHHVFLFLKDQGETQVVQDVLVIDRISDEEWVAGGPVEIDGEFNWNAYVIVSSPARSGPISDIRSVIVPDPEQKRFRLVEFELATLHDET